jgi:transposase
MEEKPPYSITDVSQADWNKTPESVKRLVTNLIEQFAKRVEQLEHQYQELKAENQLLKEQVQLNSSNSLKG